MYLPTGKFADMETRAAGLLERSKVSEEVTMLRKPWIRLPESEALLFRFFVALCLSPLQLTRC